MRCFLSFIILILIAGCCKVHCDGTELGVSFRHFKANDTDTVLFFSYAPNSGRTQVVDSFRIISVISPADTSRSSVSHAISSKYDWNIILPSLNKQYIIEGFELNSDRCKCGGSEYKYISRFLVNGVRKEGMSISLD